MCRVTLSILSWPPREVSPCGDTQARAGAGLPDSARQVSRAGEPAASTNTESGLVDNTGRVRTCGAYQYTFSRELK